jgi:serine/threonine protein kinase
VTPHIGLEVTPSIRLTRPLGAGGMGSVWVGHHAGLNAEVAVKFLSPDLSTSEGAQYRFANEASTAAQIKSPHVVQVHDHGVFADELPFIVMELLDGEDLARRVRSAGPLDVASSTLLVVQLGHVLAKAHHAGIVHRDVKPENVVLLNGYGEIFLKLIDFGIAKRMFGDRALTATGSVVGTPDFMCPEQLLSSKDVGPQVDAWSLSAVAYFALVGAAPFARETVPATFLAIERGELTLPFQGHGIGSGALDAFFTRALHRDPAARFASLAELVEAFCNAAEVRTARTLRSGLVAIEQVHLTGQVAAAAGVGPSVPRGTTITTPSRFESSSAHSSAVLVREEGPVGESGQIPVDLPRSPTTAAGTPVLLARPPPRHSGRLLTAALLLGAGAVLAAWAVWGPSLQPARGPTVRPRQEMLLPPPTTGSSPVQAEATPDPEPREQPRASAISTTGGAPGATLSAVPTPETKLPRTSVQAKETKRPTSEELTAGTAPPQPSAPTKRLKDRGF